MPAEEVSCKAIADIGKSCTDTSDCGVPEDPRGSPYEGYLVFCRTGAALPSCTIVCDEQHDCPNNQRCSRYASYRRCIP